MCFVFFSNLKMATHTVDSLKTKGSKAKVSMGWAGSPSKVCFILGALQIISWNGVKWKQERKQRTYGE